LIAALAASAVGSGLGVFAANAWQIAAVRLLIGVGSSVAQAMILAWIVGGSGRAARGRILSRSEAFFSVSGLFIPALGGALAVPGTERLSFQPFEIGLLFSVINAIGIGTVLLGGRWADRFGRYRMMVVGLAVLTLAQALLFTIQNQLTYIAVGLFQGVACFVNPLPTIVMGDALPPRLRPRGIAVYRAVCDMALLSAPASMGLAIQAAGFGAAELVSFSV